MDNKAIPRSIPKQPQHTIRTRLVRPTFRSIGNTLFALLLIAALLAPGWAATTHAAPAAQSTGATALSVPLSGATEVPGPGDPNGYGTAHLTLDPMAGRVCYDLSVHNIAPPNRAHIHRGAEGTSGGVEVFFFDTAVDPPIPVPGGLRGCVRAPQTLIAEIIDNPADFYVNVHNDEFPAGAIRGQLATDATAFIVRVENISGPSMLPGPFSPGVWAVHDPSVAPFFDVNQPDRGAGLAALAEDGAAAPLAASVAGATGIATSGVFSTPVGADGPGPILPGGAYEFQILAEPGDYFSLASMLVQTNDIFIAPDPNGLPLFEESGAPRAGNVVDENPFWDVGSEMNEAPGMGPNQAPRQRAADTGPAEGGVSAFGNTTRGLPLPGEIISTTLVESGGTYTFTMTNLSPSGAIVTPLSPLFYALHGDEWTLFNRGEIASAGLEALAEDGDAAALEAEHTGATGIGNVGASAGPIPPGGVFTLSLTPDISHPYFTLATMVVESNDAFLAFGPQGIRLLDYKGDPRPVEEVLADFNRELAVWDAGTEANEVPGVGPNQALRQSGPNVGPADPTPGVRIYSDATNDLDSDPTNDLDGDGAGGFGQITVVNGANPGEFEVVLTNTSDTTVFPGILTPVAYAIHSGDVQLFEPGQPASPGLEALAEDGDPSVLAGELTGATGVLSAGVQDTPDGAGAGGPLTPGNSYSFSVDADSAHPYLSIASMVVPSNDTFFAFEPAGLLLLNPDGTPRSDQEIAADISAMRLAWDAGTERNQAGAAGPDQAPRQSGPNTGADEGSGNVTLLDDPVWAYPEPGDVARIILQPIVAEPAIPADDPLPADPTRTPTRFTVLVRNISGDSALPGPFSPGAWAVHDASRPFFSNEKPDRGQGLEAIAEDGNPEPLNEALSDVSGVTAHGVFNTPTGATEPGPIFPGDAYTFTFTTTPTATRLSLATMLVQSNDVFAAPGAAGIPLFDDSGAPIAGDITELLPLWDAGTERNEAPGMGPNQAPRQAGPNTGFGESGVYPFDNTTRGLPLPRGIVDVSVTESGGEYTFTIANISPSESITTPISPLFYATHDDSWTFFDVGSPASPGLESLAEDGKPAGLVAEHSGVSGVGEVGASAGGAPAGGEITFSVMPTSQYPYLSIATMVVESNDAFLAFHADGIRLLDENGNMRSVADVLADFNRELAVWDAGSEANEPPGVGPNQALRQPAPDTGPADPNDGVRIYSDPTNDLAGSLANGFAEMTVAHGPDPLSFIVTIRNTSDATLYPGVLTPVLWALHNGNASLFQTGKAASPGLEALAEDGAAAPLMNALRGAFGVGEANIAAVPMGSATPGPLLPGDSYQFVVRADAAHPYLSIASMIVPSNDAFLAFGPSGLRLLDEAGERRAEADLAADIQADLIAWDAGTERNQAGAAGPDQAPRQSGPNTGASEGPATVRLLTGAADSSARLGSDGTWTYPDVTEVLEVIITPRVTGVADEGMLYLPLIERDSTR